MSQKANGSVSQVMGPVVDVTFEEGTPLYIQCSYNEKRRQNPDR